MKPIGFEGQRTKVRVSGTVRTFTFWILVRRVEFECT